MDIVLGGPPSQMQKRFRGRLFEIHSGKRAATDRKPKASPFGTPEQIH